LGRKKLEKNISVKLSQSFDIKNNFELDGVKYDFTGLFLEETTKYILNKELIYDSYSTREMILYKSIYEQEQLKEKNELREYITKNIEYFKGDKKNQMSSVVTFIFCGNSLTPKNEKLIKTFRYHKSFLFGLKGWLNTKIIYIDSENKKIITNQLGKKDIVFFKTFL
jgi:uncharacterized protein YjcR